LFNIFFVPKINIVYNQVVNYFNSGDSMMHVGDSLYDLETPVLWVDLDTMERNIAFIARQMSQAGVAWRPHTKGIKIPAIAHKLLAAGATGITCAKLSEAEIMASAGVKDILVGNQVVGEKKIMRLAALNKHAKVVVAVDDLENARQISSIAEEKDVKIHAVVELNIGMDRAGVAPGQDTLDLVQQILTLPGLIFDGLMGWEGHVVSISDAQEKQAAGRKAMQLLVSSAELVRRAGIPVNVVTCGGSGSYTISASYPGVTEIQAGGAIFGDETYIHWGAGTTPSLFVLATITSHVIPARAIVDAGKKTFNADVYEPRVQELEGVTLTHLSSEHGVLEISNPNVKMNVGDKVNFVVGYGDWTVFLHDHLVGIRKGIVEVIWEIQGRGKLT
jgi:D-serine deaminase-like pyridoxal phosphate-dependent protein